MRRFLLKCFPQLGEADRLEYAVVEIDSVLIAKAREWRRVFDNAVRESARGVLEVHVWHLVCWDSTPDWYDPVDLSLEDLLPEAVADVFDLDEKVPLSDAVDLSDIELAPVDVARVHVNEDGVYWRVSAKHSDVYSETVRLGWGVIFGGGDQ